MTPPKAPTTKMPTSSIPEYVCPYCNKAYTQRLSWAKHGLSCWENPHRQEEVLTEKDIEKWIRQYYPTPNPKPRQKSTIHQKQQTLLQPSGVPNIGEPSSSSSSSSSSNIHLNLPPPPSAQQLPQPPQRYPQLLPKSSQPRPKSPPTPEIVMVDLVLPTSGVISEPQLHLEATTEPQQRIAEENAETHPTEAQQRHSARDFKPSKIEFSLEFITNAFHLDENYTWFMEILNESVAIPEEHAMNSQHFNDYSMANMIYGGADGIRFHPLAIHNFQRITTGKDDVGEMVRMIRNDLLHKEHQSLVFDLVKRITTIKKRLENEWRRVEKAEDFSSNGISTIRKHTAALETQMRLLGIDMLSEISHIDKTFHEASQLKTYHDYPGIVNQFTAKTMEEWFVKVDKIHFLINGGEIIRRIIVLYDLMTLIKCFNIMQGSRDVQMTENQARQPIVETSSSTTTPNNLGQMTLEHLEEIVARVVQRTLNGMPQRTQTTPSGANSRGRQASGTRRQPSQRRRTPPRRQPSPANQRTTRRPSEDRRQPRPPQRRVSFREPNSGRPRNNHTEVQSQNQRRQPLQNSNNNRQSTNLRRQTRETSQQRQRNNDNPRRSNIRRNSNVSRSPNRRNNGQTRRNQNQNRRNQSQNRSNNNINNSGSVRRSNSREDGFADTRPQRSGRGLNINQRSSN